MLSSVLDACDRMLQDCGTSAFKITMMLQIFSCLLAHRGTSEDSEKDI